MGTRRHAWMLGTLALSLLAASGCGGGAAAVGSPTDGRTEVVELHGAGTTFGLAMYQEVGSRLRDRRITLNYQPIGLEPAVAALRQRRVAFVAGQGFDGPADAPALSGAAPLSIPVGFGSVAVTYNLTSLRRSLRLDGKVLADIYRGRVTEWNAPEIAHLNPGVRLPAQTITVVHRSEAAGSTRLITQYMASGSAAWSDGPGVGATIGWPAGTAVAGDDGVRAAVEDTPGAIGYIDLAPALQNHAPVARVRNRSGAYVAPTLAAVSAGETVADSGDELRIRSKDSHAPRAYPIASAAYVLTYADPCRGGMSRAQAQGVQRFLAYLLGDGQAVVREFSFAPLSDDLKAAAKAAVGEMRCNANALS